MAWKLFKFLSSLKLAVVTLLLLSAILAAATVLESFYGMRGAYVLVYGTMWFYGVLFLLGLNVLCAALSRYPWKKHQTGFVITHLGILILLFGSWLTQRFGVDGNLPVTEGSQDGEVILHDLRLRVLDEQSGKQIELAVPEAATAQQRKLLSLKASDGFSIVADHFLPRATVEMEYSSSPLPQVGTPIVQLQIYNNRFRLEQTLMASNPAQPTEVNLGPAVLTLRRLKNVAEETAFLRDQPPEAVDSKGYVVIDWKGQQRRLAVGQGLKGWQPIAGMGAEWKIARYLPYAVVREGALVSKSNEATNPAVEVVLRTAEGTIEQHTLFALFPEFSTLHKAKQTKAGEPTGAKLRMELQNSGMARGKLDFAQSADGSRLLYRAAARSGATTAKGVAAVDKAVATGWMDLQFEVKRWLPAGVSQEIPREVKYIAGGTSNYLSAIRLVVEKDGKLVPEQPPVWLFEGAGRYLYLGGRRYVAQFTKERLVLPFQLHLNKFSIGTNPGTNRAASYESVVSVRDANSTDAQLQLEHKISMNEPLQHGGYTFYQASYQMEEGRPPVSIFSVNYDPGRLIKYLGSLVMVLGIILMFTMNPHYWNILLGKRKVTP